MLDGKITAFTIYYAMLQHMCCKERGCMLGVLHDPVIRGFRSMMLSTILYFATNPKRALFLMS